jgi:hypothetical protein
MTDFPKKIKNISIPLYQLADDKVGKTGLSIIDTDMNFTHKNKKGMLRCLIGDGIEINPDTSKPTAYGIKKSDLINIIMSVIKN